MAAERIYKKNNTVKTVLTTLLVTVLVLIFLALTVFFGFRRYLVYTDDGVRLEIPWLQEEPEEAQTAEGTDAEASSGITESSAEGYAAPAA